MKFKNNLGIVSLVLGLTAPSCSRVIQKENNITIDNIKYSHDEKTCESNYYFYDKINELLFTITLDRSTDTYIIRDNLELDYEVKFSRKEFIGLKDYLKYNIDRNNKIYIEKMLDKCKGNLI